mgnify:FL=1
MSKILILKEVKAISSCGTEIIVEQVFEKNLRNDGKNLNLMALPKIVISEKVFNLNKDNIFTHPGTGKVFRVIKQTDMFKFKKKTKRLF